MKGITQLRTTTASGKQRGTIMQSRAILLIAIMVLAYQSPFAATQLDASTDADNTTGRTGDITHILYYGSWTGQNALVNQLCDRLKAEQVVRNLLGILVQRRKILFLKNIADYFESVVDERLNQARVNVISAHPLTRENIEKLKTGLNRILGKTVLIETSEDQTLIGGIQLQVGDQVADATIKNRLAILKRTIEKEEVA